MRSCLSIDPARFAGRLAGPVTFLTALALCSCSSFRTDWGAPLGERADQFREGRSTMRSVVAAIGPPTQLSALPDGCAFLYDYSSLREIQVGLSLNIGFLKYFKFVKAWNHLDQEVLLMIFDRNGVLRSQDPATWREQLGGGSAAQFLFAAMSLSDDEAFRQDSLQHDWGRDDLQRLPIVLNAGSTLRSGANGLELRVAPQHAGQHSTEMHRSQRGRKRSRNGHGTGR